VGALARHRDVHTTFASRLASRAALHLDLLERPGRSGLSRSVKSGSSGQGGGNGMAIDETSVKVRVVTIGGVLVGRMRKGKGIRTLDALNLKGDFFALTDIEDEAGNTEPNRFMAINKSQVISLEEVS
jgi:hypothetical protein